MRVKSHVKTYLVGLAACCVLVYAARQHVAMQQLEQRVAQLEVEVLMRQTPSWQSSLVEGTPMVADSAARGDVSRQAAMTVRRTPRPASAASVAPSAQHSDKLRAPVRIDLNRADSALLVRVPGVGGATARAIVRYRQRLGGYVSAQQLREAVTWQSAQPYMDGWIAEWFTASPSLVVPLAVDTAGFVTLVRHPYLNRQQVQQLLDMRRRHGRVAGLDDLRQLPAFSDDDILRLQPYLLFPQ